MLRVSIGIVAALTVPAAAGVVRPVAVTHYPSAASDISDKEAAQIIGRASALLAKDDGTAADGNGDVACDPSFTQKPAVAAFGEVVLEGIVSGPDDFRRVCDQDGLVHVVNQLNWCGDGMDHLAGCAIDRPRPCIVVVRPRGTFTAKMEPVLWAHEYGHTKKLPHACEDPKCTPKQGDRVMHPTIDESHVKIGVTECQAFLR